MMMMMMTGDDHDHDDDHEDKRWLVIGDLTEWLVDCCWRRASRPVCESSFFVFFVLVEVWWGGVGHVNVRLHLRHDFDASWRMGWGGVGHVNVRLHLRHDFDASWRMGWGVLGSGCGMLTCACTCVMKLMLRHGWRVTLTFTCSCPLWFCVSSALPVSASFGYLIIINNIIINIIIIIIKIMTTTTIIIIIMMFIFFARIINDVFYILASIINIIVIVIIVRCSWNVC